MFGLEIWGILLAILGIALTIYLTHRETLKTIRKMDQHFAEALKAFREGIQIIHQDIVHSQHKLEAEIKRSKKDPLTT